MPSRSPSPARPRQVGKAVKRVPGWRWRDLAAIVLLALTLAPALLYGALQSYRDAASPVTGPNDGRQATFFAFFNEPYHVFAEDFHLYALRAKRIRDRGWVDNLLDGESARPSRPKNLFQYLIGRLMPATAGEPRPYSFLLFGLLFLSALVLYAALRTCLGHRLGTIACLSITVLYMAFPKYAALFDFLRPYLGASEPTVWPGFRLLRLSTYAWSSGCLAALLVLLASLGEGRRQGAKQLAVSGLLLLFALGDVWSFALAGIFLAWALAWQLGVALSTTGARPRRLAFGQWSRRWATLLAAGSAILLLFWWLNGGGSADLLERAGLGPGWRGAGGFRLDLSVSWLSGFLVRSGFLMLPLAGLFLTLRGWRRPQPFRIAGLGLAATVTVLLVAPFLGVHEYQMVQFYDRIEMALLLGLLVAAAHAVCDALQRPPGDTNRARQGHRLARLAAGMALAVIVAYAATAAHRTDLFIRNVLAQHGALPARLEALRPVLRCLASHGRLARVATLSPELNHLIAFWTDADMALPVGFPLHNRQPNAAIETRMAELLDLYRVPVETWRSFPIAAQGDSTVSWKRSRLLAARQSYIYFLFHYAGSFDHAGRVEAVARRLEARRRAAQAAPRPAVIIEDAVSRHLGRPDLDGYVLVWRQGDLSVWSSSEAAVGECA